MPSGEDNDGNAAIDPNVIRMRVENVKNLTRTNKVTSEVKRIDGFPWRVSVYLDKGEICSNIECPKWQESKCFESEAMVEVKLINRTDYSRSVRQEGNMYFTQGAQYLRELRTGKFLDVVDDESFVVDGGIIIEVKITVTGGHGDRFRKSFRPKHDFFFSPSNFSDVILSVDGKKLHVSKQILAHASPYFEALFFGDFKESQKSEIVLEDISADEFITILLLIYDREQSKCSYQFPDNIMEKVTYLLKMADRFDFPRILIEVEGWLLLMGENLPVHIALLISESYNLFTLLGQSLGRIIDKESALEITGSDSFKQFSSGLKDEINRRLAVFTQGDQNGKAESGENSVTDVIRHRVENVKNMKLNEENIVKSEVKWINGFPWQLQFEAVEATSMEFVAFNLVRKKSLIFSWWHCFVEGTFKLINHNDDSASLSQNFAEEFCSRRHISETHTWEKVVNWGELIQNKDFVVDGGIDVEVTMTVKGTHGDRFRKDVQTDFTSPSKFSDVVFVVEGKKLYASTQILSHVSSYFEKRFHRDSDDSEEREIVMKDVSYTDLSETLEMIYDHNRCMHDRRDFVEPLLRMADRFEITEILDKAELFLLHPNSDLPLHAKLRLADQYKLEVLKMNCVRKIESVSVMERVRRSDSYIHYSSELKDKLIDNMIQLLKRRR